MHISPLFLLVIFIFRYRNKKKKCINTVVKLIQLTYIPYYTRWLLQYIVMFLPYYFKQNMAVMKSVNFMGAKLLLDKHEQLVRQKAKLETNFENIFTLIMYLNTFPVQISSAWDHQLRNHKDITNLEFNVIVFLPSLHNFLFIFPYALKKNTINRENIPL